jgi:hypothetical protein
MYYQGSREKDVEIFIAWMYGPTGARKLSIAEMCEEITASFCLKERSIAQHFQATHRHHRLPYF